MNFSENSKPIEIEFHLEQHWGCGKGYIWFWAKWDQNSMATDRSHRVMWSPAGKGLTSWLSFVVSTVSLSLSHWYPGSGVVLDCIDS